MSQSIKYDRYPKFVADQVLTAKCLNHMFGYLEEQQRLTRSTLIGIGIMCGMDIRINNNKTSLTITEGVGVTSKGYLVPFPESTFSSYTDFDVDQEIKYQPFLNIGKQKGKFSLLLPNNVTVDDQKPLNADFLENKAVIIFVELLKIDNKNCDPDSCDDKGSRIEVTHRPLLVSLDDLEKLISSGTSKKPFRNEPSCIEWPEIKIPRYNVPSTPILNTESVLKNFLKILNEEFIFEIQKTLGASYNALKTLIQDEFPSNPFAGLKNKFKFLYNDSISPQQLINIQYYYDFFSDLIQAYTELRTVCNDCLSICCPDESLFPRHLILGNAIPSEDEFRHHWIQSPAFSCTEHSSSKAAFLLKKIAVMVSKLNLPVINSQDKDRRVRIRITPSKYGQDPISEKAIPYYYDVVKSPNPLYKNWNFRKSKLGKADTNLSYFAQNYSKDEYVTKALNYDIEPYNFFRIEGHIGMNWKKALADIQKLKNTNRLPIDVVALNGDIFELIRSLVSNSNNLSEIIGGNDSIAEELRCYFADIESQYDSHAAELRCSLTKVMAYFYNLRVIGRDGTLAVTDNFPISNLIRIAFPEYRTRTNTYGEQFDTFYATVKNQAYITPQAFLFSANFSNNMSVANSPVNLLNPVYLMYYIEKIHEALVDGLVELKINDLTQRLQDASTLATLMLQALDQMGDFEIPALLEESLDSIIKICKAKVFNVLYKNFLINYALFISNQSFAMYAMRNSGIQHKAGVTTGGTFILVYTDKTEDRKSILNFASDVRAEFVSKRTEDLGANRIGSSDAERIVSADARRSLNLMEDGSHMALGNVGRINELKDIKTVDSIRNPIMEIRDKSTIKGLGFKEVFEIIEKQKEDNRLSDKELTQLVDQLPDGAVIADFFVPNMCKSACTPMNFIVIGDEDTDEPTDIKLSIKPTEFCENDKEGVYEIIAEPDGGELKVDGNVVANNEFRPAEFDVGNSAFREVVISYELNADIKNIRVKIYHMPLARISIDTIDHENHIVTFKNNSQFAGKYSWDFGEGHFSDKENPGPISFQGRDSATVILTVKNGPCTNESNPLSVKFEDQGEEPKACLPLSRISRLFKKLDEGSSEEFKKKIEQYDLLKTIFIEKFADLSGLKPVEQFKLLIADLNLNVIRGILRIVNSIVRTDKENRASALLLMNVLMRLVFFYACVQSQDIDRAKVATLRVLEMMLEMISSWKSQVDFTATDKNIIKEMLTAAELELEHASSESPEKVLYINTLKELVKALQL